MSPTCHNWDGNTWTSFHAYSTSKKYHAIKRVFLGEYLIFVTISNWGSSFRGNWIFVQSMTNQLKTIKPIIALSRQSTSCYFFFSQKTASEMHVIVAPWIFSSTVIHFHPGGLSWSVSDHNRMLLNAQTYKWSRIG